MSRRLAEIAGLVDGELSGDPDKIIVGINDLGRATSDQLSFLANPRYGPAARESRAGVILVDRESRLDLTCATIRVVNPSAAFARVAALFVPPPIPWEQGIHPTAVVDPGARLGQGICIGAHVVIEPGAILGDNIHVGAGSYIGHECKIGDETFVYPNVTIRERTVIGKRVILHSGAVLGSDGFGYEFQNGCHMKVPQVGYVQIDDDVEIGANTTIDRGRFEKTWIQKGTKIDNLVMIAHNVVIGANSIVVAQCGISGSSTLGSYVTFAGQSATVGHVRVCDQTTVAGWTAVTKDITKPGVYRGAPARPMAEAMKTEALVMRLPELYKRLQALEKKLADQAGESTGQTT